MDTDTVYGTADSETLDAINATVEALPALERVEWAAAPRAGPPRSGPAAPARRTGPPPPTATLP